MWRWKIKDERGDYVAINIGFGLLFPLPQPCGAQSKIARRKTGEDGGGDIGNIRRSEIDKQYNAKKNNYHFQSNVTRYSYCCHTQEGEGDFEISWQHI